MKNTVAQRMAGMASAGDREALRPVVNALVQRNSSCSLTSAGLVISATTTLAKIGAVAWHGIANGKLVTVAAGTDMPALVGDITAAYFNVYCFFIDSASVVTVAQGTEAATLAGVKFPEFPDNKACIGFLIVTYASAFVGGTTVLSTATTNYISPIGSFDPNILAG